MRMYRGREIVVALAALVALAVAGSGCGGDDGGAGGEPAVRAVTTLPLIADMVKAVAGDRVEVAAIMPSGSDPHTYEPAPKDVRRIAEADVAFANGGGLEPSAGRIIEANLPSAAPFERLADYARSIGRPNAPSPDSDDPHLWLDPYYGKLYAARIAEQLSALDPDWSDAYQANLASYNSQIGETERYVREKVQSVPPENRKLVTSHEAFDHFGAYFGLEVVAFVARGPGQEPSPEDIANLSRAIDDGGVQAVFKEPQIGAESRLLERAAGDAGVRVCTLYSDSLDDMVKSYLDMLRFNGDEVARCLGGADGG